MAPTCSIALPLYRRSPAERLFGAVRYAGVLAVWLALFLVRPGLALDIFRYRRADSPIPRLRWA